MIKKEYFGYEAETIRELEGDIKADKILAIIAGCTTDIPFKDIRAFNAFVTALNEIPFNADVIIPLELKHVEKALHVFRENCPDRKPIEYSPEVLEYILHLAKDENIHYIPRIFMLSDLKDLIYKKGITERQKYNWKKQNYEDPNTRKLKVIQEYAYEINKKLRG